MTRDDLISDAYLAEQRALHAAPRGYGQRGDKWAPTIKGIAARHHATSVLDYGCGRGSLALALPELGIVEYDPAIEGKDEPPSRTFDLVVCTDVLEHIESDKINAVVEHLSSLCERWLVAVISLVPTSKTLSDGRQAHILLRSVEWWTCMMESHDLILRATLQGPDPNKASKEFAALFKRTHART